MTDTTTPLVLMVFFGGVAVGFCLALWRLLESMISRVEFIEERLENVSRTLDRMIDGNSSEDEDS